MRTKSICLVLAIVLFFSFAAAQWVETNGPNDGTVYSLAVSGTNLFAGTSHGGIFLTTDEGANWTEIGAGLTANPIYALAVIPAPGGTGPDYVFAGSGGDGVFLSTDNGASWTGANTGFERKFVSDFAVLGSNLFAGSDVGVFLSTDYGANWTRINNGLTSTDVVSVNVSGTDIYAGTFGGLFRSTDNGASWNLFSSLTAGHAFGAFGTIGGTLFAGTWGDGIFRSTDDGASWSTANTGLTHMSISGFVLCGMCFYASTWYGGVFLSTDDGTTWTAVNEGLPNHEVPSLIVGPPFGGTGEPPLYAGTYTTICRLANPEIPLPVTLQSFSAKSLARDGCVLLEWKTMSEIDNYGFVVEKGPAQSQQLFAEIPGSFTPGQGTTQEPQTYTFVDKNVTAGKWAYRLKQIDLDGTIHLFEPTVVDMTTTEAEGEPAVPTVTSLQQNYPNPFNPVTGIGYAVGVVSSQSSVASSHVRLAVYDLLGREVAVLVNEEKDPGNYEVKFDASGLPSGVYLYRLETGSYTQTRTLLLLR